ncbi:PA0069 family radical SAM protein [Roseateles depolymerans]|uniref:DNA repair photolyase n=1 Tax=Roseateles depolymerans TaxID=76731 RepID=A0A0U3LD59_9BURK|nr:PA0069 family radical SAM protein [Roseateles depolymerans]ALV06031.1 DNA repair photolyase [Roseateles depolymerans]REG11993.1 DNA repair photolyase [Roseateles depolymerans]
MSRPTFTPTPIAGPELYVQPDALKGRGSAWAIPHRFERNDRDQFDDGWGTLDQEAREEHLPPRTEVMEEHAKKILSSNQSPDIGFDYSINPYRGCEHGCIYCFARPTHSYLNLSPGLDFETRLVAKVNAAQRLRETLASPSYQPSYLCIGTATDAYQPVERKLGITRQIIEVLAEAQHPFSLVTKSSGVERDLDLLAPMAQRNQVSVYVSVTTLDSELARTLEPRAAAPHRHLQTIRALSEAGVPVGVSVSPLIPFLNEPELERILEAAAEAGAQRAFSIPLRLPWEVNPLFQDWLQQHQPAKAARIMARLRDMRGGKDNDARFGTRMKGEGIWAELMHQRMRKACERFGLGRQRHELDFSQFRAPAMEAGQQSLF